MAMTRAVLDGVQATAAAAAAGHTVFAQLPLHRRMNASV